VLTQIGVEAELGAEVARHPRRLADHEALDLRLLRLGVLRRDAVVADQRIRHGDDLAPVRRVGQHLLVAGHAGVEDRLAEALALKGVDLDLFEKEFVVLLGPSGSGKSTLLNILGGLDVATAGRVTYRGKLLDAADDAALTRYRRQHVGFVFQFYNLIPSLTAKENVALITEISERPMRPEEALELVGLGPRMDHFPSQLSGGEQQRVAI